MISTSHVHRQDRLEKEDEYDSFYAELERQILILMDDHDERDFLPSINKKHNSDSFWITKRNSNFVRQPESYFYWTQNNNASGDDAVPAWLLSLWRSNSSGTGVFIPQIVNSRRKNKPRRKRNKKDENTSQLRIEG